MLVIQTEKMLMYLEKPGRIGSQQVLARFRLGNEEAVSRYWQKDNSCQICQSIRRQKEKEAERQQE